jgi:hypothetical protein
VTPAASRDHDAPPPAGLADRVQAALREFGGAGAGAGAPYSPESCITACEALLDRLLRAGCATRAAATDLLVADALVTYAFEAASTEPARLEERARDAMARLSALAHEHP